MPIALAEGALTHPQTGSWQAVYSMLCYVIFVSESHKLVKALPKSGGVPVCEGNEATSHRTASPRLTGSQVQTVAGRPDKVELTHCHCPEVRRKVQSRCRVLVLASEARADSPVFVWNKSDASPSRRLLASARRPSGSGPANGQRSRQRQPNGAADVLPRGAPRQSRDTIKAGIGPVHGRNPKGHSCLVKESARAERQAVVVRRADHCQPCSRPTLLRCRVGVAAR